MLAVSYQYADDFRNSEFTYVNQLKILTFFLLPDIAKTDGRCLPSVKDSEVGKWPADRGLPWVQSIV
jgi:hypothetical protein